MARYVSIAAADGNVNPVGGPNTAAETATEPTAPTTPQRVSSPSDKGPAGSAQGSTPQEPGGLFESRGFRIFTTVFVLAIWAVFLGGLALYLSLGFS